MSIIGKLVGAIAGLLLLRNPWGMLLGAFFGHMYDVSLGRQRQPSMDADFVAALFTFAGTLSKSDGRVSEVEISAAEALMGRLNLDDGQREMARARFNEGKQPDFNPARTLAAFKLWCRGRRDHAFIVLDLLLDLVYAEGLLVEPKLALVQRLCVGLGVSEPELVALSAMKGYGPAWHQAQHARNGRQSGARDGTGGAYQQAPPPRRPSEVDPYAVLGVTTGASDAEIKRAYRKLMSQHHPDKLVGMPEEVRRRSETRSIEINAAYEHIKQERGQR